MKTYLINTLLLFLLLGPLTGWSQKLNINGEKIRVSANGSPTIVFPGEIQSYSLSCQKENFNIKFTKSSITIRAAVEKPAPCTIIIYEGASVKKQRTHRFVLEFVDGADVPSQDELYHNFSTLKLLESHVASLVTPKDRSEEPALPKKIKKDKLPAVKADPEKPVVIASGPSGSKAEPVSNPNMIETEGINIDKKEFEKRAIQKTEALGIYLKILCEKNQERWGPATEGAVALFTDEDRSVEVSNTDSKTGVSTSKMFKIRVYFKRMTQLRYDRVDISWSKMQYVSNLREQPDGSYMGIVTFEQDFKAFRDGRQVFGDVTKKNAEVKLKLYKKLVEGKEKISWDVLLGNIGVSPVE